MHDYNAEFETRPEENPYPSSEWKDALTIFLPAGLLLAGVLLTLWLAVS